MQAVHRGFLQADEEQDELWSCTSRTSIFRIIAVKA